MREVRTTSRKDRDRTFLRLRNPQRLYAGDAQRAHCHSERSEESAFQPQILRTDSRVA
jgi:hypothetical protein